MLKKAALLVGLALLIYGSIYVYSRFFVNEQLTYGLKMPKGFTVHGIDISRYQSKVDWAKLVKMRSGKDSIAISFVFIKSTEGRSLTDPVFAHNWEHSKKNGMIRGAYHYFIPNRDAKEQAQNFIKTVKLQKGDLPPVLDVEVLGPAGAKKLQENVKIWLDLVEKHYNIKPILYTYIDFYEKHLLGGKFEDYPLWIAHYYKDRLVTDQKWILWQHSDKGKIQGIETAVDFNVFNGSMEEFNKLRKK